MDSVVTDLKQAWRVLRQRPLFTLVAAASIAIGVGATTTIVSIVNAVLWRTPDGVASPERVVEVTRTTGGRGRDTFSYPELNDLRSQAAQVFEHLAGWRLAPMSYAAQGDGERVTAMVVSGGYFAVMGVRPARGRFFLDEEDGTPLAHPVAVISERFWRDRLDADENAIGRSLLLNRHSFTIVGVAPRQFHGHVIGMQPDVWIPMMMMGVVQPGFDRFDERRANWLTAVARLQPGVDVARAQAAAMGVITRMQEGATDPRNARGAAVDPLGVLPAAGRAPITSFFVILGGLVVIILLVTSANVAGMLLARAAGREREIAVRLALGSSRSRLVRQLLVEAVLLFGIGGAGGLLVAQLGTGFLERIHIPAPIPFVLDLAPDLRVLAVGLGLSLGSGIVFGLAPALQATRLDLTAMMKSTGFDPRRGGRLRAAFVMGQVGLSLVLLLAAGLFQRSLQRAATVPTGFDAADVTTVAFDLAIDGFDSTRGQAFVDGILGRLRGTPGITGAAAATDLPLDLSRSGNPVFVRSPRATPEGWVESDFNVVTTGYFEALHIRLLAGRTFDARDVTGAVPVVVVSRTFAATTWPGEGALGKTVRFDSAGGQARTIIGVVDDVKNSMLMEAPERMVYLPLAQHYTPSLILLVRGRTGSDAGPALRTALHDADPGLSTSAMHALGDVSSVGLLPQRLAAGLTSGLGALALLLSALGVYGVMALTVARRTREIGVRFALGARAGDVVWYVIHGGLRLAVPGLALGTLAGLGLGRLLRSLLLGLAPADPVTFLGVPALLIAVVMAACWAPAARAAAIQPAEALRVD